VPVIPPKSNRLVPLDYDKNLYKFREKGERFFSNSRFILKILYDLCRQALAERIACPRSRV
jgi:hypothetical protein